MGVISTATYFGISAVIVMFLFNIFHCILASIFNVRIEKFGLLTTLGGKQLLKFKRHYTEYALGWIPTGGYVKIAGMIDESLDDESPMKIEDYMLLSKPLVIRFLCTLGPQLLLLISMLISISFITSDSSFNEELEIMGAIFQNIFQYITGAIDSVQTENNWNAITENTQLFPVILSIVMFVIIISTTFTTVINMIMLQETKISAFLHIIILLCYLYVLYKLGALYFSMSSFSEVILDILKFVVPIYSLSFIMMLFIKILPKNKYF